MRIRDKMAISNRYLVRRGAVLGSDRPGEVRNSDTFVGKPRPDLWIIDQACCKPGVHAAALAATRAAVETSLVRVVIGMTAMANQYQQRRETTGQRHPPEHIRRQRNPLGIRERVASVAMYQAPLYTLVRAGFVALFQSVFHQFPGPGQTGGLNQCERRQAGVFRLSD